MVSVLASLVDNVVYVTSGHALGRSMPSYWTEEVGDVALRFLLLVGRNLGI